MKVLRFLRKSWPIWVLWVGTALFLVGLAINPFWTFVVIWVGIMAIAVAGSVYAVIQMAKED